MSRTGDKLYDDIRKNLGRPLQQGDQGGKMHNKLKEGYPTQRTKRPVEYQINKPSRGLQTQDGIVFILGIIGGFKNGMMQQIHLKENALERR